MPEEGSLFQSLMKIAEDHPEIVAQLKEKLGKLATTYIYDVATMREQGYFYHNDLHASEMMMAALLAQYSADALFAGADHDSARDGAIQLYVKLLQALFAVHDIVQGKNTKEQPHENEEASAKRFIDDFGLILDELKRELKLDDATASTLIENLRTDVAKFAETVIVDGTVFDFKSKRTEFLINFLSNDPNQTKKYSLVEAMSLAYISVADTMYMTLLPMLLRDPAGKAALEAQQKALGSNLIMQAFDEAILPGKVILHGKVTSPGKVTSLEDQQLKDQQLTLQRYAFMHLWGQNLRVVCEIKAQKPNKEETILSSALQQCQGFMGTGAGLESLTDDQVEKLYDFITKQMGNELDANGFVNGIAETAQKISEINEQFRLRYGLESGFDVIPDPYKEAWKDYGENACDVLRELKLKGKKRAFVNACMEMARHPTGYFLKPPETPLIMEANYTFGNALKTTTLQFKDIVTANTNYHTDNPDSKLEIKRVSKDWWPWRFSMLPNMQPQVAIFNGKEQIAAVTYTCASTSSPPTPTLSVDLTKVAKEQLPKVMELFTHMALALKRDDKPIDLTLKGSLHGYVNGIFNGLKEKFAKRLLEGKPFGVHSSSAPRF